MREDIDRTARRSPVREPLIEAVHDRREIERVLRQRLDRPSNVALDGLGRFSEERVGHALAARYPVALTELDEHDLLRRVRRARYRERHSEMELEGPHGDVQAGTASRSACAIRSAPAAPSRTGSAAGSPVSIAAVSIIARANSSLTVAVLSATATTRAGGYPGGRRHAAASS